VFPRMKVVHITRDPRAMINSQMQEWPTSTPHGGIRLWKCVLRIGRKWGSANPGAYAHLRYEDLVGDPVGELRRVCRILGLTYRDELLEFEQPVAYTGGAKGMDPGRPQRWRQQLSGEIVHWVEAMCASEMNELGYERSFPEFCWAKYLGMRIKDLLWRCKRGIGRPIRRILRRRM
jgi:hypothetical protein